MPKEFPKWLADAAKSMYYMCDRECEEKRSFMVPLWRRAEFYWNDIQDVYYNAELNDMVVVQPTENKNETQAVIEANKIVNTYRAYGESLIAAATIGNLSIRFFPGNADEPLDIDKAKSYSDISDYIQRENDVRHLRRRTYTLRWNQGFVASYTYFKRDAKKYGTVSKDIMGRKVKILVDRTCADCGEVVDQKEYEDPVELANDQQLASSLTCPACGSSNLNTKDTKESVPYSIGKEDKEKGCSVIELYSPLEVKFPYYAKETEDINYLILDSEIHFAKARSLFPDYADQINPARSRDEEDRTQADHYSAVPSRNLVHLSRFWCLPDMYYIFKTDSDFENKFGNLEKKYPDGLFAIWINDLLVFCQNVDFRKHWSFCKSPLDSHVLLRPLGNSMIPVQDMENDLVYLTLDTIKHAIGETFYDSEILNRTAYEAARARPGNMVPVKKKGGKQISDHFFSTKTATLSQEVDAFHERLEVRGQLVTGAFPSVYGGQFSEGSKTLGVYQESKAQALQRAAIPANGVDDFLTQTIFKATEIYAQNMEGDESYSVEMGDTFRNQTLTKPTPDGRVSRVETVRSEQFPTTWEQKRAFIMELLNLQLDPINATIFSTDNISLMARIIGIPELKVPGDADRNKILREIQELLQGQPIQQPMVDETGQPIIGPQGPAMMDIPSIPPDVDVDNHQVAMDTIISWAVSPEGVRAKKLMPSGYLNVIARLKAHRDIVQQQQMAQVEKQTDEQPVH